MTPSVIDDSRKRNGVNGAAQLAHRGETSIVERPRYSNGWRTGKPEEDPDKMKRWGLISAQPSEFLVRMRGGKVVASGQGASTFKWPWDSVAVVPTTAQPLHFTADQITSEKVGVRVTGIAVYRIADPLIAFRMLNFTFSERAQEKLSEMLEEMFVGATRRLVANLSVEQCLTRRKDALASELMREIAPVVGGTGRVEDRTVRGWGVVIDSIEIQDVRIMSNAVFTNMQARFRQEQEQKAREAELSKERAVRLDETNTQRQIELGRVATAREILQRKQAAEEEARLEKLQSEARVEKARLEQDRAQQQAQLAHQREIELAKIATEQELRSRKAALEEQTRLDAVAAASRIEQARIQGETEKAEAEAQARKARNQHEVDAVHEAAELEQARALVAEARRALSQIELATVELELKKQELAQSLELWRAEKGRQIENTYSPEAIQMTLAQNLPELAKAFQQHMGTVNVTAIDGANPFGYVAAAVQGVISIAESAGLKLPKPTPGQ